MTIYDEFEFSHDFNGLYGHLGAIVRNRPENEADGLSRF